MRLLPDRLVRGSHARQASKRLVLAVQGLERLGEQRSEDNRAPTPGKYRQDRTVPCLLRPAKAAAQTLRGRYPGVPQTASRTLLQSVSRTLTRAKYLSLASTSVHGAISVLVRSTMSHTARS